MVWRRMVESNKWTTLSYYYNSYIHILKCLVKSPPYMFKENVINTPPSLAFSIAIVATPLWAKCEDETWSPPGLPKT